MYRSASLVRAVSLAAAIGIALTAAPLTANAAGNSQTVQECVRDIAMMERAAARKHKGLERRVIIAILGKIKIACMDGKIEQAYSAAAKFRDAPQQAEDRN